MEYFVIFFSEIPLKGKRCQTEHLNNGMCMHNFVKSTLQCGYVAVHGVYRFLNRPDSIEIAILKNYNHHQRDMQKLKGAKN